MWSLSHGWWPKKLFLERHVSTSTVYCTATNTLIGKHSERLYRKSAKMSEEGLLKILSSLKAMRKLEKRFRINVGRTLKIHQKYATPLGMFILEKQPNLSRKSELGGVSSSPVLMPLYPTLW